MCVFLIIKSKKTLLCVGSFNGDPGDNGDGGGDGGGDGEPGDNGDGGDDGGGDGELSLLTDDSSCIFFCIFLLSDVVSVVRRSK